MPKEFLKRYSPSPKTIREYRALDVLGERIHRPNLWHLNRRSVAKAFAIGLFCTWLPIPFQTIIAASLAVLLCANVPLSVVLVFITNPITIPPMFYFAYRLGASLLGLEAVPLNFELSWEWISNTLGGTWAPLLLGSLVMGTISSVLGFATIRLLWRIRIVQRWEHRKCKRKLKAAHAKAMNHKTNKPIDT